MEQVCAFICIPAYLRWVQACYTQLSSLWRSPYYTLGVNHPVVYRDFPYSADGSTVYPVLCLDYIQSFAIKYNTNSVLSRFWIFTNQMVEKWVALLCIFLIRIKGEHICIWWRAICNSFFCKILVHLWEIQVLPISKIVSLLYF